MTPERQILAIAEACGWTKVRKIWEGSRTYPEQEWVWKNPDGYLRGHICIPNYLSDLNAMHEAEKTLKVDQIGDYENRIYGITDYRDSVRGEAAIFWSQHSLYRNIHATAAQRAEAFLRTIGRWEDDPKPTATNGQQQKSPQIP